MEPLDPQLAKLVREGMSQAIPGPEREERVLRGLLARLPAGPPPGGNGGPAEGGRPLMEPGAPAAAAAAGGSKAMVLVAVLGGALIGGGWIGGGWIGDAKSPASIPASTPASMPAKVDAPPSPPEGPLPHASNHEPVLTPVTTDPLAEADRRARSTDRPKPRSRPEPTPAPDALADEIQRIAAADGALARGDAEQALELARAHAKAHPRGQLGVERTAIEVSARCQLGRPGAVEAATAFLRAHGHTPAAAKVRARCPDAVP
ncbi:hypothetical protein [Paraliomyxa miuraensis]|uniref:hypothetical protein n=1 Tax=Paraliomyxa miuraensis TaxID=376150 RepID=UPI00224EAE43|nr:hypothetical protein [Paraliomyxa miuraensis]MCX4248089.1 hypothetical protein [Paraliomyxa miuraensis]